MKKLIANTRTFGTTVELEDIRKYDKPIKPKRFVPVGGQYIREK